MYAELEEWASLIVHIHVLFVWTDIHILEDRFLMCIQMYMELEE